MQKDNFDFLLRTDWLNANESWEKSFTIDRPVGFMGFMFLHFTTDILLQSTAGRRYEKAGVTILYGPGFPQWYTGVERILTHDWIYVEGESVTPLVENYAVPLNQTFFLRDDSFIRPLLAKMREEHTAQKPYLDKALFLLYEQFILELGRNHQPELAPEILAPREKWRAAFTDLRHRIAQTPEKLWTVPGMARELCLSPNRFAVLYKEFFGTTPVEDLIRLRLQKACWMLASNTAPVIQVARECGFGSVPHFTRLFHRRIGCAPSRYYSLVASGELQLSHEKPAK